MRSTHVIGWLLAGLVAVGALRHVPVAHAQQPAAAALPQAWTPPPPPRYTPPGTIAVRAGRLFDPRSGALLTNQVVLIQGERVVQIGSSVTIPPGATIIDLSRATVLPGLIDTHLHMMTGSPLVGPGGPASGRTDPDRSDCSSPCSTTRLPPP